MTATTNTTGLDTSVRKPRIVRRNIHTYPFKYRYYDYDEYFALEPAVLYLHIPFCIKKCGFCDYTVYTNKSAEVQQQYARALEREVRSFPSHGVFPKFAVEAVYFGGGTPGILEGHQLARLLQACRETFPFKEDVEVGLEFDPPTVTAEKLAVLRDAGFNRVNLGIQAFDDDLLRLCNRSHNVATAEHAYSLIQDAGFSHVNIDLIFPLPTLTLEGWKHSVERAIELNPGCITAYGLEIWPKTAFHRGVSKGTLALPTPEEERAMYEHAIDALEHHGFERASSTGYYHPARCPRYSRFLEYYWRTWPMIGFGVSSKSVIHDRLYTNVKDLKSYFALTEQGRIPLNFATYLTREQEMRRVMIRGLKMCDVSKTEFRKRFGIDVEAVFGPQLQELSEQGYLREADDSIMLTRQGQVLSTSVYERFYADDDLSEPASGEVRFGISELVD